MQSVNVEYEMAFRLEKKTQTKNKKKKKQNKKQTYVKKCGKKQFITVSFKV